MSMISAQIDELRQMADGQATYRDAREVMLEAADTIWQLRDDLQRANAENDKLRNEVDNLTDFEHLTSVAVAYAGCDECGEYKQTMLRLFAENAKLRELVWDMLPFVKFSCDEEYCPWYYECDIATCYAYDNARERAGELGIEVDE